MATQWPLDCRWMGDGWMGRRARCRDGHRKGGGRADRHVMCRALAVPVPLPQVHQRRVPHHRVRLHHERRRPLRAHCEDAQQRRRQRRQQRPRPTSRRRHATGGRGLSGARRGCAPLTCAGGECHRPRRRRCIASVRMGKGRGRCGVGGHITAGAPREQGATQVNRPLHTRQAAPHRVRSVTAISWQYGCWVWDDDHRCMQS